MTASGALVGTAEEVTGSTGASTEDVDEVVVCWDVVSPASTVVVTSEDNGVADVVAQGTPTLTLLPFAAFR